MVTITDHIKSFCYFFFCFYCCSVINHFQPVIS